MYYTRFKCHKKRLTPFFQPHGFALPTVLIMSVVLLTIGVSLLQLATATTRSLQDQNWNRLAKTAAQAGVTYAASCLKATPSAWAATISPSKDCNGAAITPAQSDYIVTSSLGPSSTSTWRSTFTIAPPTAGSDGISRSKITGKVELVNASSVVLKTYTHEYNSVVSIAASTPSAPVGSIGIGANSAGADTASCMIANDQQIYCAGENDRGNLGDGTIIDKLTPVLFGGPLSAAAGKKFTQVDVGYRYACGLTTDQLIYCAGENSTGQLGYSILSDQKRPVQFGTSLGLKYTQLDAGLTHTCALTTDQLIYCAGTNIDGRFGTGSTTPSTSATPLRFDPSSGRKYLQVSTGTSHTCALATDLYIYCAGAGNNYELGNGVNSPTNNPTPVKFGGVASTRTYTQVAAGQYSTCGLTTDQVLYCSGNNGFSKLGNGTTTSPVTTPTTSFTTGSAIGKKFTQIGMNGNTTCALSANKLVLCGGDNTQNQLGYSSIGTFKDPVQFGGTQAPTIGMTYTQLSVGSFYTCAVGIDQKIYCSGDNNGGQQGVGNKIDSTKPSVSMCFTLPC